MDAVSRPPPRDLLLIAVAVAAVSTSAPLIREAQAPALAIAFWRNALAVAVLGPVCAVRRREEIAGLDRAPTRGALDVAVSGRALVGDLLALAGGALAAAYVTVGGDVRQTMSTTLYTAICYATAAAALGLLCLGGGQALGGFDGGTWLCLLALTVGPQFLGHSVVNRVLRTTSATVVSVAILFEIVGATFLAWLAFGESPPAGAYPAAVLIAVGIVLVVLSGRGPEVAPVVD